MRSAAWTASDRSEYCSPLALLTTRPLGRKSALDAERDGGVGRRGPQRHHFRVNVANLRVYLDK